VRWWGFSFMGFWGIFLGEFLGKVMGLLLLLRGCVLDE